MVKVYIDMDEGWRWWPVTEDHPLRQYFTKPMTLEIDDALLEEYKSASEKYFGIQSKLEQLYRIQEGLDPLNGQPLPDYIKIPNT